MSSYQKRLEDIADRIGVEFGVPTALRSREMADLMLNDMGVDVPDEDDREDLVGVMADGIGVFLRRNHSRSRSSAMNGVMERVNASVTGSTRDERPTQTSLPAIDFPITVPGEKTVRIGNATCLDVESFIRLIAAHIKGYERTMHFCINMLPLWDGQDKGLTLEELVFSGAVTMDDIEQAIEARPA